MDLADALKLEHPTFENEPTQRVQYFIDKARGRLGAEAWGSLYDDAIIALAAHLLTKRRDSTDPSDTGAGPVILSQTDDHMKQWANPPNTPESDPDLQSTDPGKEFIRLRKKRGSTGTTV